mmetsp:Transcript_44262/g.140368  ORF Transcript_44262/g.140368 Transcript_44262/m.140368 type:complete len:200 (-) Transcript_44262:232-831(-)
MVSSKGRVTVATSACVTVAVSKWSSLAASPMVAPSGSVTAGKAAAGAEAAGAGTAEEAASGATAAPTRTGAVLAASCGAMRWLAKKVCSLHSGSCAVIAGTSNEWSSGQTNGRDISTLEPMRQWSRIVQKRSTTHQSGGRTRVRPSACASRNPTCNHCRCSAFSLRCAITQCTSSLNAGSSSSALFGESWRARDEVSCR